MGYRPPVPEALSSLSDVRMEPWLIRKKLDKKIAQRLIKVRKIAKTDESALKENIKKRMTKD